MKNKKILGALAALCMGIILCVSSVFAVNYWYTITNTDNNGNNVTMGNALTLNLADAAEDEVYLYPGGHVTFKSIVVTGADDWKVPGIDNNVENVELPKFALRVRSVTATGTAMTDADAIATFGKLFTVYSNYGNGTYNLVAADDEKSALATNLLILDNLQVACDTDNEFDLRLAFDEMADAKYADAKLTFTLEIVAYLGTDYANATKIFVAEDDEHDDVLGSDPADADGPVAINPAP